MGHYDWRDETFTAKQVKEEIARADALVARTSEQKEAHGVAKSLF